MLSGSETFFYESAIRVGLYSSTINCDCFIGNRLATFSKVYITHNDIGCIW